MSQVRKGQWSRAIPVSPYRTTLKVSNPFVNEKPFQPKYDADEVDMNKLMNSEYHRMWKQQHEDFMRKRRSTIKPVKKPLNAIALRKTGTWSRAIPVSPYKTTLKVSNPFVNQKPFQVNFDPDEVEMNKLMNFDYNRMYQQQKEEFMEKRQLEFKPIKKSFPIYRKAAPKPEPPKQNELPKKAKNKFAHVKPKVTTFRDDKKQ